MALGGRFYREGLISKRTIVRGIYAQVVYLLLGADDEYRRRNLADGWWRTSDLARFDDEGRISIVGRASETIITGGTNNVQFKTLASTSTNTTVWVYVLGYWTYA